MGKRETEHQKTMKPKALLVALFGAILLIGCTRPVMDYSYLNLNRLKGWKENTHLHLNFEMPDSSVACELYIVGEIATKRTIEKGKGYPIDIVLVSPDSVRYTDTIILPTNVVADEHTTITSHGIRVIEWPYRKNIYNRKPGKWSIILTKGDTTVNYSNIIGIGVCCKQK